MKEAEGTDFYATAAQASINERCAPAFLHDVRGSMQALFSAFELLGRSARLGGNNSVRVEKACDLARRAILYHEKSTMEVLELLTQARTDAAQLQLGPLVTDVVHFLRNDAATKEVTLELHVGSELHIYAERAKFRTMLVGLMTAAIDATPAGTSLNVAVERYADTAQISIGCDAGYSPARALEKLEITSMAGITTRDLTLLFATRFLTANFGRLEIDSTPPLGAIRIYYRCSDL